VVGCFLALHLVAFLDVPFSVWGIDSLAYQSTSWIALFVVMGIAVSVPWVRRSILGMADRVLKPLDLWQPGLRGWLARGGLLAISVPLLIVFSSSTHLLGDGQLYLRDLGGLAWEGNPREERAPLVFWIIRALYELGGRDPELTYRLYSWISGLLFALVAVFAAGAVGKNSTQRKVIFGLLLSSGVVQIFFGYVENYALPLVAQLSFIVLAMLAVQGRASPWFAAVAFGVALSLHLSMIALIPALAAIPFLSARAASSPGSPGGGWVGRSLLVVLAGPAVSLGVLLLVRFDFSGYLASVRGSQFLPVFGELSYYHTYHLFSWRHGVDLLNLCLLSAPAAVMALFVVHRPAAFSAEGLLLVLAATGPFFFSAVINPEIGAFRDWDVLSLAAIPLTLLACVWLTEAIPSRNQLAHTGLVIGTAGALHTAAWVGVNAGTESAVARYRGAMETAYLSRHGQTYGWESLGAHYQDREDLNLALPAYEKALESASGNPRLWIAVGSVHARMGRPNEALSRYRRAAEIGPDYPPVFLSLGILYHQMGDYEKAIEASQKAVDLDPDYASAWNNMGNAYTGLKQYEAAIPLYQRTLELQPRFADAYYNLGAALINAGRPQEARDLFRTYLELRPDGPLSGRVRNFLAGN
jgi:Tfp pilus assembly protein PilF